MGYSGRHGKPHAYGESASRDRDGFRREQVRGQVYGAVEREQEALCRETWCVTIGEEGRQRTDRQHGQYGASKGQRLTAYHVHTGYATFFPNVGDYDFKDSPTSWNKVVAMRHAMTKFPNAMYMWYVDVDTFIMNPQLSIEKDIMAPGKLEEMMITDHPVVPPDSIIHTFAHLSGGDVDVLVTQDMDGLATASFVMRNSEWSRFFLETWFDPMYRSYNFQKAETHALVRRLFAFPSKTASHIPLDSPSLLGGQ